MEKKDLREIEQKAGQDLLTENIDRIHTTDMGMDRIKRNLSLKDVDVVEWCKEKILDKDAEITRQGKNWYVKISGIIITINANSYTIITAHKGMGHGKYGDGKM
jgi:hypothetical protein